MSLPDNPINGRPNEGALAPALPAKPPVALTQRPAAPPAALAAGPNVPALLRSLRRRWVLAFSIGIVLGALGSAAVWFLLPPAKNTANVQLQINLDANGKVHEHADGKIESVETFQANQVAYIRGRLTLNAALRSGIKKLDTLRDLNKESEDVEWLEREVRVDFPSREIIRITVSGENVEDLKQIANAVSKAYLTEHVEKQIKERQTRLEELRKIHEQYKNKLAALRRVKSDLAKKSPGGDSQTVRQMLVLYKEQEAATRTQLIKVKQQIQQLEVSVSLHVGRDQQMSAAKAPGADDGEDPFGSKMLVELEPRITSQKAEIARIEVLIEETKSRLRDPNDKNNPALRKLYQDLETAKVNLRRDQGKLRPILEEMARNVALQQVSSDSRAMKAQLEHLKALEKSLLADLDRYGKALEEGPGSQVGFQELEFDIEQAEEEVKTVGARITKLDVEKDDPPRVRPLQDAIPYKVDNFARKVQMSAAAGIGLLGATVLGIAFLEFRSRRVSTVDDVTQGLGVRVVGTVPACPKRISSGAVSGGKLSYWKSMLAESVDAARTLLLHYARRDNLRIILVTSASGGEGKTSLSCHLAVSMARSGRKTLLIDCDLRNPSAHKLFNIPLEPGLSSVLRSEIPIEEALHETQAGGLWLMPAGACDAAALSMLAQDGVQTVFDRLRSEFDFIIVDSSPVLPVADSLMTAQQVDGVLFAILREVSRLPKVHEAYQKLVSLGVPMLGAVVNGTSGDVYGYGYNNKRYLSQPKS
jgi:capsular exopolysaccharide synthesis family protein